MLSTETHDVCGHRVFTIVELAPYLWAWRLWRGRWHITTSQTKARTAVDGTYNEFINRLNGAA